LFYDLGLKKVPLKKSELKKGRRGGRGGGRRKGFSLFFREEYPAPRRAYSLRKKREREKGKETEGGGLFR